MNGKTLVLALVFGFAQALAFGQNPTIKPAQLRDFLKKADIYSGEKLDTALLLADQVFDAAMYLDSPKVAFAALRSKGFFNEDHNRYEAAREAYRQSMAFAENNLGVHDQLNSYNDWAIIHKKLGNFEVAREFHQRAIEGGERSGDWEMVENGHHGLATMFSMMSDFDQSAQSYLASIRAAEKWGNRRGIVLSQQNLANIYMKAKNFPMAQKNIEAAFQLANQLQDSVRIGSVLKIWGNIAMGQAKLDSAYQMHFAALQIFQKKGKKGQASESWLSLAEIFLKQGKFAESTDALKKCGELKTFFSPYSAAYFPQIEGKLWLAKNQPDSAIGAFQESLGKTDKYGFLEIARENHLQLAELFSKKKQPERAFEHAMAATKLDEQIFEAERQKSMTEANFKFDVQKRDFQITTQQKELQQSKQIRGVLAVSVALLLGLLLWAWSQSKQKQTALARSEMLMKELHHRVKNNLQTITSMMRMQVRQISDPVLLAVLNENRARLEMIGALHQQLYQRNNIKTVDFEAFVHDLIEKIEFTYALPGPGLKTEIDIQPAQLEVDIAMPLALIINELLTNSFKYGFAGTNDPTIKIKFLGHQFRYSDNGCGFPTTTLSSEKTGFGHQLISNLAQQLKFEPRFFNENGACFEMLPKKQSR